MAKVDIIILNGDIIEYDDSTHSYYVNGNKCISVTQLLHFKFPAKYDGIDSAILKRASEYGTKIHSCIELHETLGIEYEDVIEVNNFKKLKEDNEFEVLETELLVVFKYKGLSICGRLDLIISQLEKIGLADIKTTSKLDIEYLCYQLNLYKLAYEQTYHKKIDFLSAVWLRKNEKEYRKIPISTVPIYKLLDEYIDFIGSNNDI